MHLSTWKFRPRWGGSVIIPMLDGAPRAPRLAVWDSVILSLSEKSDLTFRDQHFDYIFECHVFIFSNKERPRARDWWKNRKEKDERRTEFAMEQDLVSLEKHPAIIPNKIRRWSEMLSEKDVTQNWSKLCALLNLLTSHRRANEKDKDGPISLLSRVWGFAPKSVLQNIKTRSDMSGENIYAKKAAERSLQRLAMARTNFLRRRH